MIFFPEIHPYPLKSPIFHDCSGMIGITGVREKFTRG